MPAARSPHGGARKGLAAGIAVALVCALLVGTIRNAGPYRVGAAELAGWKLVAGDPEGPVLVGDRKSVV